MKENLLLLKNLLEFQKKKIYKYMTEISKKMYIDKLNHIVNKYNNIYHKIIKMKPVDVKACILTLIKKIITKVLNIKLVIMLEYETAKTFLQKNTFEIGLKRFL